MKAIDVKQRLNEAVKAVVNRDYHLLKYDLSERCVASRLAMYLQPLFSTYSVDVEYNRLGDRPKRLGLPEECANYHDNHGDSLVVPDVIVHRRGPNGPHILVVEMKKTSNPDVLDCDCKRVRAFHAQLGYRYGALIQCETRKGRKPGIIISEWLEH